MSQITMDQVDGVFTDEQVEVLKAAGDPLSWAPTARQVVVDLCRERRTWTADDVWDRMPAGAGSWRGLGAVMRALAIPGRCAPTDTWVVSDRPGTQARPVRVWASLIRH
jgi:hypothetical protein